MTQNRLFSLNREDEFRVAFAHIGDLRSLLPEDVHIMALTAILSMHLTSHDQLSMRDMAVIPI